MYLISDGGINTNVLDTIESIMLTKNMKDVDGVKLDVRLSQDEIFVVSRYEELEKFTYSKGTINNHNYNYLRKVKFPSHIFKYFIPTLDEILKNYNKNKIIVLEIYSSYNLDKLYILLKNYSYKYYFLSKEDIIINRLIEHNFNEIGKILNSDMIINSISSNDLYTNTFLIKD